MFVLLLIVVAIVAIMTGRWGFLAIASNTKWGRKTFPTSSMSLVSQAVYKHYMSLPADSRPFPDIVGILRELDAKYEPDSNDLRRHYDDNAYVTNSTFRFSLQRGGCSHKPRYCKYHEYAEIYRGVSNVKEALAQKERVLHNATHAGAGDMAKELAEALRSEANIQNQVTKELS